MLTHSRRSIWVCRKLYHRLNRITDHIPLTGREEMYREASRCCVPAASGVDALCAAQDLERVDAGDAAHATDGLVAFDVGDEGGAIQGLGDAGCDDPEAPDGGLPPDAPAPPAE